MCDLCSMQEFAVLVRWGGSESRGWRWKGSDERSLSAQLTHCPTHYPTAHPLPHTPHPPLPHLTHYPTTHPLPNPLPYTPHPLPHSHKQPSHTHKTSSLGMILRKEKFKRSEVFPILGGGDKLHCPIRPKCSTGHLREGWSQQKPWKSWHCQDWFAPPPPPPNLGTLVDFTTKSAYSTRDNWRQSA